MSVATTRGLRIRTAWKNKRRAVSVEEHATAAAAAAWRIALHAARDLHAHEFDYAGDAQRLAVMREYLYFLIHFADRRAQEAFDAARRARFTACLARECRRHYRENERDIMAAAVAEVGEAALPAGQFTAQLNRRLRAYAGTKFVDGRPGYAALRKLALRVRETLGDSQTNKWALEQVLDIDGPEAARLFGDALQALQRAVEGAEDAQDARGDAAKTGD